MATLHAIFTEAGSSIDYYINYSVSSTTTSTTLTISSYDIIVTNALYPSGTSAKNSPGMGIKAVAGGTTIFYKQECDKTSPGDVSTNTITWTRTASAQSKSLALTGYTMRLSQMQQVATNSVNVSVPAATTYNVTYNANGHGTAPATQTKLQDQTLTLASAISATGFSFVRWNTKSDNTGTGYNAGASYTSNAALSLYAIWNHSVTYNANGGSGAPSAQTALATSAITLSSTKPTLSGYTFKHWNTNTSNTGTTYASGGSFAANSASITLYAIWERTVTYSANGGSGAPASQTAVKTSAITLSTTKPTYSGYTFKHWNTNSSNTGTTYASGGSYPANTASATLYAIWERTVTYNANGGSGAPAAQTAVKSSAISLSATLPTKEGYRFVSWNTQSDGSGTSYNAGGSYAANNPSVTLYAQWAKAITSLTIGNATAIRTISSSSTTESDDGEYAYIQVPYTVTGAAAGTVVIDIIADADSGLDPIITIPTSSETKSEGSTLTGTFTARASGCNTDVRYTFTIELVATNTTVTQTDVTATRVLTLSTAFFTMDFKAGGKGVHFGAPAIDDGFWVSMPTHLKSSNITLNTSHSGTLYGQARLYFKDFNNTTFAYMGPYHSSSNGVGFEINGFRSVNGSSVYNGLGFYIAEDGTRTVSVSTPAAWRDAIGAVNKAGDTMTGNLYFTGIRYPIIPTFTNVEGRIGQTAPSSSEYFDPMWCLDKDGRLIYYMEGARSTDNILQLTTGLRRHAASGSTTYTNYFRLYIDNSGGSGVSVSSPAAWRSALGVVNKAGDTMTGSLTVGNSSNVVVRHATDSYATNPSSTLYGPGFYIQDKDGNNNGYVRNYHSTVGDVGIQIEAGRIVNGTRVNTNLYLYVNSSGNRGVSVNESAVWRNALGASSGVWTAAMIPNLDAGKITSGSFADARIPNLNASKITAGTLPIARGGTGTTTGIKGWTNLGTTTGTTKLTFSLSGYTDVCLMIWYSTSYLATAVYPVSSITTTAYEVYCGGSGYYSSSSNQTRRGCAMMTNTSAQLKSCQIDGTDRTSSASLRVYAR